MVELEIGHRLYSIMLTISVMAFILGFIYLVEKFERLWRGIKLRVEDIIHYRLEKEGKTVKELKDEEIKDNKIR